MRLISYQYSIQKKYDKNHTHVSASKKKLRRASTENENLNTSFGDFRIVAIEYLQHSSIHVTYTLWSAATYSPMSRLGSTGHSPSKLTRLLAFQIKCSKQKQEEKGHTSTTWLPSQKCSAVLAQKWTTFSTHKARMDELVPGQGLGGRWHQLWLMLHGVWWWQNHSHQIPWGAWPGNPKQGGTHQR